MQSVRNTTCTSSLLTSSARAAQVSADQHSSNSRGCNRQRPCLLPPLLLLCCRCCMALFSYNEENCSGDIGGGYAALLLRFFSCDQQPETRCSAGSDVLYDVLLYAFCPLNPCNSGHSRAVLSLQQ